MPKIPLFRDQIGGSRLAVGQLSKRPDVSAFAAPGQATSTLGKTVNQIAFDFGMAERAKEDEDVTRDLNNQYVQEASEWIRKNPRQNTQNFKNDFKNFTDNWIDFYASELGSRRKRLVLNKINQSSAIKSLQGQEKAFALAEKNATESSNYSLDEAVQTMITFPIETPEYGEALEKATKIFEDGKRLGRTYKYNRYTLEMEVAKGTLERESQSITSVDGLKKHTNKIKTAKYLSPADKEKQLKTAQDNFNTFQTNQITNIMDGMVKAQVSTKQYLDISGSLTRGKKVFSYFDGEENVTVDVSNLSSAGLKTLQHNLSVQGSAVASSNLRDLSNSLNKFIKGKPTLSQMKEKRNDAMFGYGNYKGVSLSVRESLLTKIDAHIGKMSKIADSKFKEKNILIENAIKIDGRITTETQKLIDENLITAQSLDVEGSTVIQDKYTLKIKSLNDGLALFEDLKFGTPNDSNNALLSITTQAKEEQDPQKKYQLAETRKLLTKLIANRNEAIKNDPFKYFKTLLDEGKKPEEELATPQEIYDAQIDAGVPFKDRRLISKTDESNFISTYKAKDSLKEKKETFDGFFAKYNDTEQNEILRNMMRRGVLTLADNIFLADPSNLVNADLMVAGSESVKDAVKKLAKSDRDLLLDKVRTEAANYSESVSGVLSTSYGYAQQGATKVRVDHALSMQDLLYDLAGYYHVRGGMSMDSAVKMALDNVINNKYNFIKPGSAGGVVRLPASLEAQISSNDMDIILDAVIDPGGFGGDTYNKDLFNSLKIRAPLNDKGTYINEILKSGKFITKSDNSGVILVDMTGNPVMIQERTADDVIDRPFTLTFDEIITAKEALKISNISDRNRAIQNILKEFY